MLRSADFNGGNMAPFAADEGLWSVQQGRLTAEPATQGEQSAAVFYLDDYLPIYYEIEARISVDKPTGGSDANGYVIFDYHSPTDFKYAGINIKTNKIEMGYRDETGWHEVVQSNKPVRIKPDQLYDVLVAVNGTNVTVSVAGVNWFTYDFEPRILDGEAVGLNKGLVDLGSDNASTKYDNFKVKVLKPELTLNYTDDFTGPTAGELFEPASSTGTWMLSDGGYEGSPDATEIAISLADPGANLKANSYLDLEATFMTDAIGGFVFDYYGEDDYKFIALDEDNDEVLIGHVDPKRGFSIDASFDRTLDAGTDHRLSLVFKGASVLVRVDGDFITTYAYNSVLVDGELGLMAKDGSTFFYEITIRTNDPAFENTSGGNLLVANAPLATDAAPAKLTAVELTPVVGEAMDRWAESRTVDALALAELADVSIVITDLPDQLLGRTQDGVIYIDIDAAGHGWFVDATPAEDSEFALLAGDNLLVADPVSEAAGRMDLLTVMIHEVGHLLGLEHEDGVMAETLSTGVRVLPQEQEANVVADAATAEGLVSLDPAEGPAAAVDRLGSRVEDEHQVRFLPRTHGADRAAWSPRARSRESVVRGGVAPARPGDGDHLCAGSGREG